MLKDDGRLVIGLPNVMTLNYLWGQLRTNEDRLKEHSSRILQNYNKAMHHVNAWDSYHFVTLLSSCGFELEQFYPTEGVPRLRMSFQRYIPWLKSGYGDRKNKSFLRNLCYTQHFVFKKYKDVKLDVYD